MNDRPIDDGDRSVNIRRPQLAPGSRFVLPVAAEALHVDTRLRESGRVRVRKHVSERIEIVDIPLLRQDVVVERVAVGRIVDAAPAIRHEGDVMIVPIVEEVLVTEKRLLLREELHVRHVTRDFRDPQGFVLRSEEITIERRPPRPGPPAGAEP